MSQILGRIAFAAALTATAATAPAQSLSDPTRPPGAGAMRQQGAQDEAPAGRQLQSVLLSAGRKLAIIDGTTVPLGGMLGEARVVKISDSEVTLKAGEDIEVLKLYPAVEKRPVKRAASRTRSAAPAPGSSGQGGSK